MVQEREYVALERSWRLIEVTSMPNPFGAELVTRRSDNSDDKM